MRYTKYFSGVIKHDGVPQLSATQFSRLMNIVSLEGRLQEIQVMKQSIKNSREANKYDIRIYDLSKKLRALTLDDYPKDVMQSMVFHSLEN